mmetsp:Transcript_70059/g.121267  ORF Transcript_70059/g.121267 Transcript_70059/m.121267 type:complete len:330 (+) Transcript_70059:37-1026(+)
MSYEDMWMQRGSCLKCGQTWVCGRTDSEAGLYGEFYCAACWDAWDEGIQQSEHECTNALANAARLVHADVCEVSSTRVGFPERNRILSFVRTSRHRTDGPSTGYSVWTGAQVMLNYLEGKFNQHCHVKAKGLRILELGAGCGLPGMGLAQLGAEVILTDVPQLCQLLEYNVAVNFQTPFAGGCINGDKPVASRLGKPPRVASLRWGHEKDLHALLDLVRSFGGLDYIIGSEITYDDESHAALVETLEALLSASTKMRKLTSTGTARQRTKIFMTTALRLGEFEAFANHVDQAQWSLRVCAEVDVAGMTGLLSCSPVVVVEMKPPRKRHW